MAVTPRPATRSGLPMPVQPRFNGLCSISPRRYSDRQDCWHICFGDVHVGNMWEHGERMPTQKPNPIMPCPCGETFDSHLLEHTPVHVPDITAAQQRDGIIRR